MTSLPQAGETWIARDGRVAQVFENPDPGTREAYPLAAEYSDGVYCLLLLSGKYSLNGGFRAHHDLVRRSPWESTKRDIATFRLQNNLALLILDHARVNHGLPFMLDAQSEALEFVSWAELRGLTPDNLASMRGKVAA